MRDVGVRRCAAASGSNRSSLGTLKKLAETSIIVFPGFFGVYARGRCGDLQPRRLRPHRARSSPRRLTQCEYENWTDVDGIFSANPQHGRTSAADPGAHLQGDARALVHRLQRAARRGGASPVMRKKIPIRLRNTFNLDNPGTLIVSERLPSQRDVDRHRQRRRLLQLYVAKIPHEPRKGVCAPPALHFRGPGPLLRALPVGRRQHLGDPRPIAA